ncbi:hypothetical protein [Burkholderia ambifaria]|uniref:hypothetical protein n=1 Tax=Burkholderia ambifaria TaxID=152480 RepID=UPI001FC87599|nr:hypothetical protein [Burkholderia ambifaria]
MKCAAENATINNSHADKLAANPIGYIRADDLKELAAGNGAIISPKCGDTDVPVFASAPRTEVAGGVPDELPHWFDMFLTNVCELPDRNSPEGEPDAIVATLDELRNCAVNAIEQCVSYAQPPSADAAAAPADERAAFEAACDALPEGVNWGDRLTPEIAQHIMARAAASQSTAAAGQEATEAYDYDDVVSICDAHGIGLPVDCIEMVVEIVRHSAPPAQVATRQGLTDAARDVLAERSRQIEQEGWTPEHDDQYRDHELSGAAGCYAMHTLAYPAGDPPPAWPWAADWWKPTTHRRNLVKAGALIQAAIERLDRTGAPQ